MCWVLTPHFEPRDRDYQMYHGGEKAQTKVRQNGTKSLTSWLPSVELLSGRLMMLNLHATRFVSLPPPGD